MITSTNCVQMKAECPSTRFASWSRHYLNALCHFGPCHAYKQKVCKLDISYLARLTYRVTWVLFRVNCIKKEAEVLSHNPIATGLALVGLVPPKQSSKPSQIEIRSKIKLIFVQNVKPHCINVKSPYRRLSGDGSVATSSFSLAISFFGNNG